VLVSISLGYIVYVVQYELTRWQSTIYGDILVCSNLGGIIGLIMGGRVDKGMYNLLHYLASFTAQHS
jgi:hypothetical protein